VDVTEARRYHVLKRDELGLLLEVRPHTAQTPHDQLVDLVYAFHQRVPSQHATLKSTSFHLPP
jgi:hypothetical protein